MPDSRFGKSGLIRMSCQATYHPLILNYSEFPNSCIWVNFRAQPDGYPLFELVSNPYKLQIRKAHPHHKYFSDEQ
jgi:hypothetical protein